MPLTTTQTLIIMGAMTLGTVITRFLPFILFRTPKSEHSVITYLGQTLPYAAIGLLVVYCLKGVTFTATSGWVPEAISIGFTALLHVWKGNTLLSIGLGTVLYMVLVQVVFV